MHEGAAFLTYVGESAGHSLAEQAGHDQAYNEYLKQLISRGAGVLPLSDILPGGKLVGSTTGAAYSTAADSILGHMIDTNQVAQAESTGASLNQRIQRLLEGQITSAVIAHDAWPEGRDPVTWAQANPMDSDWTFVRAGKLMPMDDIRADAQRTSSFFTHYLRNSDLEDGGRPALLRFEDQIEGARASGDDAREHWR